MTEEGVLSLLLNLDPKKSVGSDSIPNAFLIRYAKWSAKYPSFIFKSSLSRAELPNDWKHATITPVPKTDDHSLVSSFMPVSLLCSSVKILEHIIFKHLTVFVESNNLITAFSRNLEHGFRKEYSTVTQLIETFHDLAAAIDMNGQVDVILLDFEKLSIV